jgi:hypothetical protein
MHRVGVDRHVRIAVTRRRGVVDDDARVGGDAAVFVDDQRVEIEFLQPRQLADHLRDVQQDIFERFVVDRRHVAELAEQFRGARRLDQVTRQEAVERRQGHCPVAEHLDFGAAGAKSDDRAEDRVTRHTDHQLTAVRARQVGFDRQAIDARRRVPFLHRLDDVVIGVAGGRRVGDVQPHAADFALVDDVRRIDLHGDRETDLFGEQQRFGRRVRDHGLRDRNAEGAQDGLRFHFRENLAALVQYRLDQHLGAFGFRARVLRRWSRRLQQQLLVPVVGRDVVVELDGGFRHAERRNAGFFEQGARFMRPAPRPSSR